MSVIIGVNCCSGEIFKNPYFGEHDTGSEQILIFRDPSQFSHVVAEWKKRGL